jgi:hypothetical protein
MQALAYFGNRKGVTDVDRFHVLLEIDSRLRWDSRKLTKVEGWFWEAVRWLVVKFWKKG